MNDALKKLIESGALSSNVAAAIEEAWKVQTESLEEKIRDEHGKRYAADKEKMAEAMNTWLKDNLKEELQELAGEMSAIKEQRVKYASSRANLQEQYKQRVVKEAEVMRRFVIEAMKQEIVEVAKDRKAMNEARVNFGRQLKEAKINYEKELGRRVQMLEGFVIENLGKEIKELHEEMSRLSNTRASIIKESKQKIKEFRQEFVHTTASAVERFVSESAKNTFTELKSDILEARKNHFGRKVFEAFAAEYMGSYLAEGSAVKAMEQKLEESIKNTTKVTQRLQETAKKLEASERRVTLVEDRAQRNQIMATLLRPLPQKERKVMEQLLEGVKTQSLKGAYDNYLPSIINEAKPANTQTKRVLNETRKVKEVSGNKPNTLENLKTDDNHAFDEEIQNLQKMAGLRR